MSLRLFCLIPAIAAFFIGQAATVDTIAVTSKYLDSPENVVVIKPDVSDTTACPTVYLLNGYSGNHKAWIDRTRPDLPDLSDRYGFVFVLPDGRDSWYWDVPNDRGMQMESFITRDLVSYIDSVYNTIPMADKRAITGLSMGGHGAMWLAFRHPDIWKNVGSMSGGLDIRPFHNNWNMKSKIGDRDDNPEIWDSHTVIKLVPTLTPGEQNIIFDCGINDFFFEVNNNMHEALVEAHIPHDYTVRPGAHTHDYWANSLLYHLLYFNENFKK